MSLLLTELLKLRTTRTFYALLGGLLAIVALSTIVMVLATPKEEIAADPEGLYASPLSGIIFVLLLGVMLVAGEYRHGTITQTLLITPARWKVLAAKLVAAAILGVVVAVAAELFALLLGAPLFAWKGVDLPLGEEAWTLIGGTVLAMALAGPLGVAFGALIRNQVVAIIAVFVWLLIAEPILTTIPRMEDAAEYLPGQAMAAVVGADEGGLLTRTAATAVLLAYVLAFSAIAERLTLSRDVNSIQA